MLLVFEIWVTFTLILRNTYISIKFDPANKRPTLAPPPFSCPPSKHLTSIYLCTIFARFISYWYLTTLSPPPNPELVQLFQQQHNIESVEWNGWVEASDPKKKGSSEKRLCVVGPNRTWLLKAAKKKVEIAVDVHYLNITQFKSDAADDVRY